MALQNPNNIMDAVNTLVSQYSAPVPTTTIPTLGYTAPSADVVGSQFLDFLNKAAQSPDIINYYKQILDYAKGDVNLAKQQIEQDYQTGVRQITDNLKGNLANLGLTFTQESNQNQDSLNKRGISLTQDGQGQPLKFAGGGQAETESATLNTSQQLRQEAEQRSASQGVEKAGLTRTKALTSADQSLRNQALDLQGQQQQAIYNRASIGQQSAIAKQYADAAKASQDQQNKMNNGGGGSNTRSHINPATGVWDDNYFSGT